MNVYSSHWPRGVPEESKKTVLKMKTVTVKGLDYFFVCQIHMEL